MSNGLYRLGRWIAAHHRLVLVAWVVAVLGVVGLNRVAGGEAVDDFRVPGVESQAAVDLLEQRFPERAGATAMVVFHVDDGTVNDPRRVVLVSDVNRNDSSCSKFGTTSKTDMKRYTSHGTRSFSRTKGST